MAKRKLLKLPSHEGEIKCTLPLKKITKKEAKELERLRNEYRGYDEEEIHFISQSPVIDYLVEEQLEDI